MARIKGVLLDLSGVLYVGDRALPGAQAALARLGQAGLPLRFVTNTTRSTRARIQARLQAMGFDIPEGAIFTAPGAVRRHLLEQGLSPYLLIHPDLAPEFDDIPQGDPQVVVLGDAGEAFSYAHLNQAFRLLMDGAPLIAMGNNRYFRDVDGLSLDIGPFAAALEYAAGVQGQVLGKPAAGFFHAAVAELGCAPAETVMVGDDAAADVEGALRAGLQAVLVKTGKYREGDERRIAVPGWRLCEDIGAAVDWILAQAAPAG